jgi:Protein of unknown function (DUF1761)
MEKLYINHLAVFLCALLSLVIGALWYSPLLFFRVWQKESGLSDEQIAKASPLKTYSLTLILAWIISYNLAFFLGNSQTNWRWGLVAGLLAGVGWASTVFVIISLFEQRSLRYVLINCGYITVYFGLIGFVLGIWR